MKIMVGKTSLYTRVRDSFIRLKRLLLFLGRDLKHNCYVKLIYLLHTRTHGCIRGRASTHTHVHTLFVWFQVKPLHSMRMGRADQSSKSSDTTHDVILITEGPLIGLC